MTLLEKQFLFSKLIADLIQAAYKLGYDITFGEAWRTPEQARIYEEKGIGIVNSLHRIRLAIDLNLFKDGKWLKHEAPYKELGEVWTSFSGRDFVCVWGGEFGDPCHFSIEHGGVK